MTYALLRVAHNTRRLGTQWDYMNRLTDENGATLFSGVTPRRYFTKPVVFQDANGKDAIEFGANRNTAPSRFISRAVGGDELFRIDLPVAAKLRTKTSMTMTEQTTGQRLEIVPSHVAAANEAVRLVAVLEEEFVVRHDGHTVAYTGGFDPENVDDGFGKAKAQDTAATILSDLAKIPSNIARTARGERDELPAGKLTVHNGPLQPALALTLLLFRAYIYREIQSPEERWWQGS